MIKISSWGKTDVNTETLFILVKLRIMESQLRQSTMMEMNEKLLGNSCRRLHIFKKNKKSCTLVHQFQRCKRSAGKIGLDYPFLNSIPCLKKINTT